MRLPGRMRLYGLFQIGTRGREVPHLVLHDPTIHQLEMPSGPDAGEVNASMFLESVSTQLGLKLQPITAPVRSLVIDHIEEPTPN
jgi:uncharacterized protein (TIGR03435 family)